MRSLSAASLWSGEPHVLPAQSLVAAAGTHLVAPSEGVAAIGNAPTALLAVLDLAGRCRPPACVIATCPGFSIAAEAKEALFSSGLPYVAIAGTRGGSGLAAAALNFLLGSS